MECPVSYGMPCVRINTSLANRATRTSNTARPVALDSSNLLTYTGTKIKIVYQKSVAIINTDVDCEWLKITTNTNVDSNY